MILWHGELIDETIFEDVKDENLPNKISILSFPGSFQEARKNMVEYIAESGFKSYYSRYWFLNDSNILVCDYGSHTRFFYFTDISKEEFKEIFDD